MTIEVIAVGADTAVHVLAALLSEGGISGVPVVDPDNRAVGIVSAAPSSRMLARSSTT